MQRGCQPFEQLCPVNRLGPGLHIGELHRPSLTGRWVGVRLALLGFDQTIENRDTNAETDRYILALELALYVRARGQPTNCSFDLLFRCPLLDRLRVLRGG